MAATARSVAGTTERLVGSGLWFGAVILAANVLNAVFQVALARALTPGEYSLVVTLFSAVGIGAKARRGVGAQERPQAERDPHRRCADLQPDAAAGSP